MYEQRDYITEKKHVLYNPYITICYL